MPPTPTNPLIPRHVVRLSGALAALLGRADGAELPEDEMLGWLREAGLITYPSRLLELPEVFAAEVLPRVDPTGRALLARVGHGCRAAVVASGLPCAGTSKMVPFKVEEFLGSIERLAWAKENGCPWVAMTCAAIAGRGHLHVLRRARELGCPWDTGTCTAAAMGGHLEVLVWAREHGCEWDLLTCAAAAEGGHLEVLKWAREYGCPWDESEYDIDEYGTSCCALAAAGGHLEVLKWAQEHGSPWDRYTCGAAARGGHLEVLKWAHEHGCPWGDDDLLPLFAYENSDCCALAALGGHLEVLRWAREHGSPWNEATCAAAAEGGHLEVLMYARENGCSWDEELDLHGREVQVDSIKTRVESA